MYRVGLEGILGFTKRGDTLLVEPRVPVSWPEYTIEYRHGTSVYEIVVRTAGEGQSPGVSVDGRSVDGGVIGLVDDGARHVVTVLRTIESATQMAGSP
jgi:cyclic beta-1,2-glucan synthetase